MKRLIEPNEMEVFDFVVHPPLGCVNCQVCKQLWHGQPCLLWGSRNVKRISWLIIHFQWRPSAYTHTVQSSGKTVESVGRERERKGGRKRGRLCILLRETNLQYIRCCSQMLDPSIYLETKFDKGIWSVQVHGEIMR